MDTVERIGVEKSRKMIEKSELLFAIFDISRPFDEEDELIIKAISEIDAPKIALLNKCDLEAVFDESKLSGFDAVIKISAKEGEAKTLDALASLVNGMFTDERIVIGQDAVISCARQHAALTRALDFLSAAAEAMELGFSQDAASSDIERALGAISELDGRAVSEEIVGDIFARFCVGK